MQNFLWASLDNFCLKLKISNLQHLQNGKINFIFLRACFEAIELLASKTAYSGVFFSSYYASPPHQGTELTRFFNNQDSWGRSVHLSSTFTSHCPSATTKSGK